MDFQGGTIMVVRPDTFYLFFLLIPVVYILYLQFKRGHKDLGLIGGKFRSRLIMDVFIVKWFFSSLLFILFIIFSILAAADFTGPGKTTIKSSEGIDLVFLVDISGSMLATDVPPSRLKRSTDLISAFIENIQEGRFGLVVFKGEGIKIIPVTEDRSSLSAVLPYLSPDMFSSSGSNLENGINTSLSTFTKGEERKKIILIFTDGEVLDGDVTASVEKAKNQNVDIIIIGTGTSRGIEIYNKKGDPIRDNKGNIVISRLNNSLFENMSLSENIFYLNSSDSTVLKDSLDIIKKRSGSSIISDTRESRYRIFLSFAILFLFLYISVRIFPWKDTF